MAKEPSITWRTSGVSLNRSADLRPSLEITEYPDNLSMGEGSGPYGIPIDAPLAVNMIKTLRDLVSRQPADNELRQLIEGTVAITFDRNVLLKTISQPKCEGIRFYLCVKPGINKGENVLSLVTVGVDATGKDLLYDYKEGTPLQDIPTRSLLAEYGYPPGKLTANTASFDPFVLFKFSE